MILAKKRGQLTLIGILTWVTVLIGMAVTTELREEFYSLAINATGASSISASIIPFIEPFVWLGVLGSLFVWVSPTRPQYGY